MSFSGLLRKGFGPEEDRSRPSRSGDKVGDLGKASKILAPILEARGTDGDLVGLAAPLPNEAGARFESRFTGEGSRLIDRKGGSKPAQVGLCAWP
jgi:hypothetical protein